MKRPLLLVAAGIVGLLAGFTTGWRRLPNQAGPAHESSIPKAQVTIQEGLPSSSRSSKSPAPAIPGNPISGQDSRPGWSAQKRLIRLAFEGWSKETRNKVLWYCFLGNYEAQRRLLDFLLASDDPEIWASGRDFLISNHTPEFIKRLLEAYAAESVPGRRAMLAHVLGGNAWNPETHAVLIEILGGADEKILHAMLPRLNMEAFGTPSEAGGRIKARLRELATTSGETDLRMKAVRSLRGDSTEEGIRFFLGIVSDSSVAADIRRAAISSLPISFSSHPPMLDEQLAGLWCVVHDESCDLKVREAAADRLKNSTGMGTYRPTEADQQLLKKLLKSK